MYAGICLLSFSLTSLGSAVLCWIMHIKTQQFSSFSETPSTHSTLSIQLHPLHLQSSEKRGREVNMQMRVFVTRKVEGRRHWFCVWYFIYNSHLQTKDTRKRGTFQGCLVYFYYHEKEKENNKKYEYE